MSDLKFQSALGSKDQRTGTTGLAVQLREISDRGMIDLRGNAGSSAFMKAAATVLGIKLPVTPRSSTASGDITVFWLSPDQWLVCCARGKAEALLAKLTLAIVKMHAFAVNVSDARCIIRIEGDGGREVLMKGVPVDLTGPMYSTGMVRRIQFAEIAALVHFVSNKPDVIDLFVFRSYADHAWDWLAETGRLQSMPKLFTEQAVPGV